MSTIRKKPFIEDLIEDLSDEQKSDLLDVMNGSGNTTDASFTNMPVDDISNVLFKLEDNNLKTGILIQSENYTVLLAYHRFQDMQIFKLNKSRFTYEKVNEYLDINELRRVLGGNGSGGGSEDSPKIWEVENIENIPSEVLDQAKAGDLITFSSAESAHFYSVITKSESFVELIERASVNQLISKSFRKNESSWEPDWSGNYFTSQVGFNNTINTLSFDSIISLQIGDLVGINNGNPDDCLWLLTKVDYNDNILTYYFCKIEDDSLTFVRYLVDEDEETATFDTSYGTSGYNVINLGSSSEDTLKHYDERLTFNDQNGNIICSITKILALKTEEWYYEVLNSGIQNAASMLGLTIPTITDSYTAQTGITMILQAMQQAGASSGIPAIVLNFVADSDFLIKQTVSHGTEIYPLFVTGDISAYILAGNGTITSLLQAFDFTDAYSVSYSLMEVNVVD